MIPELQKQNRHSSKIENKVIDEVIESKKPAKKKGRIFQPGHKIWI